MVTVEIVLILIASLMWSFVGVMVKASTAVVSSSVITFSRFFFGVVFLGLLLFIRDRRIRLHWKSHWIWIGAAGKCCNYIFENIALQKGPAYGNVLVMPIQALLLIPLSILFFKEKMRPKVLSAALLCTAGISLINWNGRPLSVFFQTDIKITFLFALSALGVSLHFISQKALIQSMESADMNFSVFLWSTIITAFPLPFSFKWAGPFNPWILLILVGLGFITGISFYIYAVALKKVPFLMASIIGNSSVLLSLVWSSVFFQNNITMFIISGSVLFLTGIILLNMPQGVSLRRIISLKNSGMEN